MRRAWFILPLIASRVVPARAQVQGALDVGASHVNEAGVASASGVSAGGTLDAVASRGWLRARALAVAGSGLQSSVQGLAAGAYDLRESSVVRPFLGASGSFFSQSMLGHSTSGELSVGARLAGVARGASVAGTAGTVATDGASRLVYRALADSWLNAAAERFSAELAFTSSEPRFVGGVPAATADGLQRFLDLVGAWRHERGGVSFGLTGGLRGATSSAARGGWGVADVAVWVAPRAALTFTAGNSLEDVVRGIPRTTYVTAAIRIATQPHLPAFGRAALAGPRMLVRMMGEGQRIEVVGVAASHVEIMADFTAWQPVTLAQAGTVWYLDRHILPGPHRVALRLEGGEWMVPSNLPHVEDDLGGTVGVITIP